MTKTQNTDSHRRAFVLETARIYVPGSVPTEIDEAQKGSGGGCCDSAPIRDNEQSSDCGTPSCGTGSASPQSSSRCC